MALASTFPFIHQFMNRRLSQHALGAVVRLARLKLPRKTRHPYETECQYQRGNASAPQFPGCRCAAQLERPLWRDGGLDASRAQESRRERTPEEDDEPSAMWKCSERATFPLARKKPALENRVSDFSTFDDRFV